MKKYRALKCILNKCQYDLDIEKLSNAKPLGLDMHDSIKIFSISESNIKLTIERKIFINDISNSFLTVSFDVEIDTNEATTKDEFIKNLKESPSILTSAFSQASLLISQITNMSLLRLIITPPTYDKNNVEIM